MKLLIIAVLLFVWLIAFVYACFGSKLRLFDPIYLSENVNKNNANNANNANELQNGYQKIGLLRTLNA